MLIHLYPSFYNVSRKLGRTRNIKERKKEKLFFLVNFQLNEFSELLSKTYLHYDLVVIN